MIIGTLGKKGHGKDTVADYIVKKYGYEKCAFADPIKEISKILFSFTDEQLHSDLKETIDDDWGTSPRIVMQYIGTDIFRKDIQKILPNIGGHFWVKSMEKRLKNTTTNTIISDVRFQNEADCVKQLNGIVFKIERPSKDNSDKHISEIGIDSIKDYDFHIINDGSLKELYNKVDAIMATII